MPNKHDQAESIASISRQAAVIWLLLKDQRRLSLDDAWRILLWIMRSRRHVYELLLMRRQDARLTRLLSAKSETKVVHVDSWRAPLTVPAQPPRRCYRAAWTIAAMLLLMMPVLYFIAPRYDHASSKSVAAATQQLERRQLDDGSVVSANTLKSMRVDFTEKQRGLHLFHGSSLLEVAADRERPFVVHTFLVDITSVIESKFAVRIDTSVEVEVFEGLVEVSGHGAKAGLPVIRVQRGETYRVPVDTFRAILAQGGESSMEVRIHGRT
jgi:ferric-dicitrate binding protein FerR (iron transport regulator)